MEATSVAQGSWERLNEPPVRGLCNWSVSYQGEPRKGAPSVLVDVWIPKEVAREGIGEIADYLEARLGWKVHRNGGWGSGNLALNDEEWTVVNVKVRSREIREALKERSEPTTEDPRVTQARADAAARSLIGAARAACTRLQAGTDAVANAEAMGELKFYAAGLAAELERRMS